jgi:glycosyltransferase involved in cell wall biosynthesis
LQSLSLICLSKEFWDNPRKARKQLLFEVLIRQNSVDEILYVNPFVHRWCGHENQLSKAAAVSVWQGKYLLPGERFAGIRYINRLNAFLKLRKQLLKKPLWHTIYYDPWDVPLARCLTKFGFVFFDWTEDWNHYYENDAIGSAQKAAIRAASGVLTVSDQLRQRACDLRRCETEVFMLPNATGWRPIEYAPCPLEMSQIPTPRLGFLGHLGPWFDVELVVALAGIRPEWQWVMIGSADLSVNRRLRGLNNIHLLGQKPYHDLQSFMANCQALVAPYRANIEGDATKLYDYLTLGLPIVSSKIETARRLQPHVRIADDVRSWQAAIEQALMEKSSALQELRRKASLRHTWDVRARDLLAWLSGSHTDWNKP